MKRLLYLLLVFGGLNAKAQVANLAGGNLKELVNSLTSFRNKTPIEKLYLQTDKPYYTLGDTLRFKTYLLNADYLTPSARSGLLYVELDDAANRMVKRIMLQVVSGCSWGDIALNATAIHEGSYTLRAYTNWMRNFGEDYVFKKNIYVAALNGTTLIKADFKLDTVTWKKAMRVSLRFTGIDKTPIGLKDIQLRLMDGKHNLFKDKITTGINGASEINFDLPDKTAIKNLSIKAQQMGNGADTAVLTIPVTLNRPENTDLQFMPEGGNLIAGIPTRVGFKAISEDGRGTDVTGKIVNNHQQEVATITSSHKGMGSFELTPQAGENYTATIVMPNKTTKSYPLPPVKTSGTALRVTPKGNDSLEITLTTSPTLTTTPTTYLIGQARGVVCYAQPVMFKEGSTTIKKTIAKDLFPTGIARFTLLSNTNQPLNERMVYIDLNDNLNISVNASKPSYNLRDSIALNIQVKDKDGKPVQGTFSLAVTDDSQVRTDSIGSNILNNLLLTSDLKGTVEEPGWYFEQNTPGRMVALDNLLLTQGWTGYDWKDVFDSKPAPLKFDAEPELAIKGRITGVLNNSVGRVTIALLLKTMINKRDTVTKIDYVATDKTGRFSFKSSHFALSPILKSLQPANLHPVVLDSSFNESFKMVTIGIGKAGNTGITIENEFKPPVFTTNEILPPWYVNSDTLVLNNNRTKITQLKAEANYRGEGRLLKVVNIADKKIVKGSKKPEWLLRSRSGAG